MDGWCSFENISCPFAMGSYYDTADVIFIRVPQPNPHLSGLDGGYSCVNLNPRIRMGWRDLHSVNRVIFGFPNFIHVSVVKERSNGESLKPRSFLRKWYGLVVKWFERNDSIMDGTLQFTNHPSMEAIADHLNTIISGLTCESEAIMWPL